MKNTYKVLCAVALAASATAVSCQKEVAIPEASAQENEVSLFAFDASTKTQLNPDWSVNWVAGDALTVFNGNGGSFSSAARFDLDGTPSEGKFVKAPSAVLLSGETSYDWFASYPYSASAVAPGATGGYSVSASPVQVGYNSAAHVAEYDLLAGKALGVAAGTAPSIAMHHVGALMKFTVTNNSGEAAAIKGLSIDAAAGGSFVAGTFSMDWTGAVPTLDPSRMGAEKSYVIDLTVKKNTGTAESPVLVEMDQTIADGESVDLYIVAAPFSVAAGEKVKFTIKGSLGNLEIEKTMGKNVSFAAGSYNTAALSYVKPAPALPGPNLVNGGDFSSASAWTIVNRNSDPVTVMTIADGQLSVARPSACTTNYRWICYQELSQPLEVGKWYKMSVKISVPTPCTWYSRGIDLAFGVFGKNPGNLDDYKANSDKGYNFFVDTDMESARQSVGPLHGTSGFVNFPTVCTYCNPAELKGNGGVFQAVAGQKWVGFYLRQRSGLASLNPVLFDDVVLQEVEAPGV